MMRYLLTLFVLAAVVHTCRAAEPVAPDGADPLAAQIVQMERGALDRWNNGDPSGYMDLLADDVVYFDPSLEQRLDGKEALVKMFEPLRGKIHADKYEMLNPKVQAVKGMAVLTYNLVSVEGQKTWRWNSTEVYRREGDGKWRIIQSHWSLTKPEKR
jgi:ketosteroid isomerase-like protein